MGPAPKHPSQRRRNNSVIRNSVKLPARGRIGSLPVWPVDSDPNAAQRRLWVQLWKTPQSVVWEQLGWERTVARYTIICLIAETTMTAPALAETRQLEDRLGLSPMAMRRLGWEIAPADDADAFGGEASSVTALADYRAMVADADDGDESA